MINDLPQQSIEPRKLPLLRLQNCARVCVFKAWGSLHRQNNENHREGGLKFLDRPREVLRGQLHRLGWSLSAAFMQERCHDLLRDHLSIRQLTWHVTMSASDRGTMSVYLRAKFENELGPQVGFEPTTHWLTAQRLSSRNQTADHRMKSRKSEEKTHSGS